MVFFELADAQGEHLDLVGIGAPVARSSRTSALCWLRRVEAEAEHYSQWLANDRQLRQLVAEMRAVADEAITLILRGGSSYTSPAPEPPKRPHEAPGAAT